MSTVIERIGEYVVGLRLEDLNDEVIDYAKRILLDSIACAYGGLENELAGMVRDTTMDFSGSTGQATIFGMNAKTTAPFAALANGVAMRYEDYNDYYIGVGWGGHPSDNITTLLAVAEWQERSGRDFLLAMVAAYEVSLRFADLPVPKLLWHRGWHHTGTCAYSGAAGAGRLLGLDAKQMAHAMALSGARSNTFSEIRNGAIPMDKALSGPIVATQSIFYALLARRGFTGCATLLEGPYGFRYAVAGGVDVEPLVPQNGDFRILKVSLKPYPIEGMASAMVQAAIELKNKFNVAASEIESIRMLTFEEALTKPGIDAFKNARITKEMADHSFSYCVAVALIAGECTSAQFSDEWLQNSTVAALMAKTQCEERPEFTAEFKRKNAHPAAVEVKTRRGVFYNEVFYSHGDPCDPLTWTDVTKKFTTQAEPFLGPKIAQKVVDRTFSIESEANMGSFAKILGGQFK